MTLPDGFHFTQGKLQDYLECKRRFQLRYLIKLAWPALLAEPYLENERLTLLGNRFHQIVHQHLLGMPEDRITQQIEDPDLQRWWKNYLQYIPDFVDLPKPGAPEQKLDTQIFPEVLLSSPIDTYRLTGKYDLISIQSDQSVTIFDWKTSLHPPKQEFFAQRLQTRLYPFLLIKASKQINPDHVFQPHHLRMIYWFTNFPDTPLIYTYSQEEYLSSEQFFKNLIAEIHTRSEVDFHLTNDVKKCLYCVYRSLCNRGTRAGDVSDLISDSDMEEEPEISLDFDQIAEVIF